MADTHVHPVVIRRATAGDFDVVATFNDDARRLYETLGYVPVSTRMRKPFGDVR